eukprot:759349-Hanusia_phi.AAC.2
MPLSGCKTIFVSEKVSGPYLTTRLGISEPSRSSLKDLGPHQVPLLHNDLFRRQRATDSTEEAAAQMCRGACLLPPV